MYDKKIDTFIELAHSGSLAKAGAHLYLTKVGVLKQINSLEASLNVRLFNRSRNGFSLTKEGEYFLEVSLKLVEYSTQSLARLQKMGHVQKKHLRLGSSFLNPASSFIAFWKRIHFLYPQYEITVVPFDDNSDVVTDSISKISNTFDFFCGLYDTVVWNDYCAYYKLKDDVFCIAVARDHPLSAKRTVTLPEISSYPIILPAYRTSPSVSLFEDDLRSLKTNVDIHHTKANYDLNTFNKIIDTDQILISFDCWKDIHPSLVTIPIKTKRTIPFGIVYGKHASEDVLAFIKSIREHQGK